jgi:hypothetical protein
MFNSMPNQPTSATQSYDYKNIIPTHFVVISLVSAPRARQVLGSPKLVLAS